MKKTRYTDEHIAFALKQAETGTQTKQHHGQKYARFRGLSKVQMQRLIAATAQNMKKMALLPLLYRFYSRLKVILEASKRPANEKKEQMKGVWKNIAIATFGRSQKTNPTKMWG